MRQAHLQNYHRKLVPNNTREIQQCCSREIVTNTIFWTTFAHQYASVHTSRSSSCSSHPISCEFCRRRHIADDHRKVGHTHTCWAMSCDRTLPWELVSFSLACASVDPMCLASGSSSWSPLLSAAPSSNAVLCCSKCEPWFL